MWKYFKIWWRVLRMSAQQTMMYRTDMIFGSVTSLVYFVTQVMFIQYFFAAGNLQTVAGFSTNEVLLVLALSQISIYFMFVFFQPNAKLAMTQIHRGGLDFLMIKPVDARFLMMFQKFVATQAHVIILYMLVFVPYLYMTGVMNLESWQWMVIGYVVVNSIIVHALCYWLGALVSFIWPNFSTLYVFVSNSFEITKYPKIIYPSVMRNILIYIFPILLIINPVYEVLDKSWGWDDFWQIFLVTGMFVMLFLVLFKYGLRRYSSAA